MPPHWRYVNKLNFVKLTILIAKVIVYRLYIVMNNSTHCN